MWPNYFAGFRLSRNFHTAAAAPAPIRSVRPPSMGALLGSLGGVGWACSTLGAERNNVKFNMRLNVIFVIMINTRLC